MKIALLFKQRSNIIYGILTLIVLVMVAFFFFRPSPNVVDALTITKSNFASTIVTTGKVTSDHIIPVKAEVAGTVARCHYSEGDPFAKGDILLAFDQSDYDLQLEEAKLGVDTAYNKLKTITNERLVDAEEVVAQANLAYQQAEEAYLNNQVLFEAGVISKHEVDDAKTKLDLAASKLKTAENQKKSLLPEGGEYRDAEFNIRNAEIKWANAQANVENTKVKAPFDGIVLKKYCEQGEYIEAGKDLFLVADSQEELYVKAAVDEKYLPSLKDNLKVYVHPEAFDTIVIEGRIKKIAPAVDSQKGTIDIEISLSSIPEYLKRDLSVSLEVVTEEYFDVIVLDKQYIIEASNAEVLVKQGNAKMRKEITITKDLGNKVIVGSGLQEGEVILLPDSNR